MGLILYPSEIKSRVTKIRYYLDSIVSCYSQAEQAIRQFKDNEKLNSMAWEASKETMYVCYQLIVQGILNVQQDIIDDLEILEMNIGDEILIEDDLNRQIEALEMEIQSCQENIDMWTTSKMVLITGWIPCVISINSNNEKINLATLKKAELEAKLQKLHDIEATTATLLLSAIDFIRVVRQAISDGGIVLDGGEVSPYADWMTTINTKLLANNVDEINSAVKTALGMEMDQLQELYGEDAITKMKYAWNQELMQRGELSKEDVIICMVKTLCGYTIEIVNGECSVWNANIYLTTQDNTLETIIKELKQGNTAFFREEDFDEYLIELIKKKEGIHETYIGGGNVYSIGHGCDFTQESDPELYRKYVLNHQKITWEEADALLREKIIDYTDAVKQFMDDNDIELNQNQFDALVSYYYNNGKYVFSDEVYNAWIKLDEEHKERAEARNDLKQYLILNNGHYDEEKIVDLFVKSKGPNMKYDYEERRTVEANLFNGEREEEE